MKPLLAIVPETAKYPDVAWIRKYVPVRDVAKALGLRISHGRTRCWRTENHTHADIDPSLHLYERRNRVRCFVCDMRGGHSVLDFVSGVLAVDFGAAVQWIAERFPIPNAKPGRPPGASPATVKPYRVLGTDLEVLVRSGLFGELTAAERSILVTLWIFRDAETGVTVLSYRAIMRYSGVGRRANVSEALKHLQRLHALQVSSGQRIGITRQCSGYRVTLEDPKFLDLCNGIFQIARPEIERERAFRLSQRKARELNTAGGLRPPDPPSALPSKPEEQTLGVAPTCEGLNLSSPREPLANKAVPIGNREISFSPDLAGRLAELQRQAQAIKAKYGVQP